MHGENLKLISTTEFRKIFKHEISWTSL